MRQTRRNSALVFAQPLASRPFTAALFPPLKMIALLLLLFAGRPVMANSNEAGKDLDRLVKLLPDRVSTERVQAIFGEATIITINNKTAEEWWQYKADDRDIYFRWDTKTGNLKSLTYSTRDKLKQTWSNTSPGSLTLGVTTLKQVVSTLGDPTHIYLQSSGNSIKYAYADATVTFQFKGGVLYSEVITAAETKDGAYISVE
jgi:hypothetical protein